jgi:hypothetical protein
MRTLIEKTYKFLNNQITFDLIRLKSFDNPEIVCSYDDSQEEPMFILNVNDESYFYINEIDRDADCEKLTEILEIVKLVSFLEERGFQVHLTEQDGVQCGELEICTDGGVDMIIWLNPFTKEEFIKYVKNFDIYDEIILRIQDRDYRHNFSISESVNDFTKYHKLLTEVTQILEYGKIIKHTVNKMEMWIDQLMPIIEEYKDGSDEPLDGDDVDDLVKIIKAKINLQEGNITAEEYDAILG